MRERIRARLRELGALEQARATEGAFISTIHGFCARLLRANALAAGIDPEFTVLDELEARRLADEAFDGALQALAEQTRDGVELIAAYGAGALRERDQGHPRRAALARADAPGAAPSCRRRRSAPISIAARRELRGRGGRGRRRARRDPRPRPAGSSQALARLRALRRARGRRRAVAGGSGGAAPAGRKRRRAERRRCASPTARRVERLTADLRSSAGRCGRATCSTACSPASASATPRSSAGASALDFEDLELLSRDLLARGHRAARPLPGAVRAGDGRRAPGHQRACSSS